MKKPSWARKPKPHKPFDAPRKPRKKAGEKLPEERDLVNQLIQQLKINTRFPFYYFIDRDSGQMRSTKSPWDFQLSWHGFIRYFEAKVEDGKLRPAQVMAKKEIEMSGGYYGIPRFRNVKSLTDCEIHLEAEGKKTKIFRMATVTFTDLFTH
jgi:hypothetical protein